jgi:hypothetical protein
VSHVTQLERVVAYLSHHADGPLKDKVQEVEKTLVKLRSSFSKPPVLLPRTLWPDGVRPTVQFTMTFPTLPRRILGLRTRTAGQMVLTTMSVTLAWARPTGRMHAVCSKCMPSRATCFLMPALSLILSSSVKRLRPYQPAFISAR